MSDLEHLHRKAWDVFNDPEERGVLSTGERLAVALILDRADWLKEWGYTLAEAIGRVGPQWMALIPRVARAVADGDRPAEAPPRRVTVVEATDAELRRRVLRSVGLAPGGAE